MKKLDRHHGISPATKSGRGLLRISMQKEITRIGMRARLVLAVVERDAFALRKDVGFKRA
jgi:hypothetical protein